MYTLSKRSILDIVPLLDVILILLFVMMLNVGQNMIELEDNAANLESKLAVAEENIELIKEELVKSNNELFNERIKTDQLIAALSKLLEEDEEVVKELLSEMQLGNQAILEDKLSNIQDRENLFDELIKYTIISSQISFIDLSLNGENNRLYINDKETSLFLLLEEVIDDTKKERKKKELNQLVYEAIENRNNGEILLITVKVDNEVDRIAYVLLQEVIDDIENEYGSDKIIRAK